MGRLRNFKDERGAQYIEYAIILTVLAVVFVVVGRELGAKGRERGNASMESAAKPVSCAPGSPLAAVGGDACK
jgi:Flp pilus assembly pilin Flp